MASQKRWQFLKSNFIIPKLFASAKASNSMQYPSCKICAIKLFRKYWAVSVVIATMLFTLLAWWLLCFNHIVSLRVQWINFIHELKTLILINTTEFICRRNRWHQICSVPTELRYNVTLACLFSRFLSSLSSFYFLSSYIPYFGINRNI